MSTGKKISNHLGFSFSVPILIGGYIVLIAGIATSLSNPIGGILMVLGGAFVGFTTYGFELNTINNTYREYGAYFGLKTGKWLDAEKLPFIAVTMSNEGYTVLSQSNRSTTNTDRKFNVCLLNESHRKKIVVKKFDTIQDAEQYANKIALIVKRDVVPYSPKISEQTRARRRSR